jgi:benzoate-CoA ligase
LNAVDYLLGDAALTRHGPRIALLCGDEALSYRELAQRVARSAAAFAQLDVRPGDRVLMLMRDTPEFAAAWMGAVRAGAVAIALNNRITDGECRQICADSGARVLLIDERIAAERPDLAAEFSREGKVFLTGAASGPASWQALMDGAGAAPAFDAQPEQAAFCLYTSGTTGQPKGIVHAHKDVLLVGEAFRSLGIGAGERVFTTSKFFFAYGLEHGLLGTLALGATSIVYPDWPDSEAVIEAVARHRPTAIFSVPSVYRRLLAMPAQRIEAFRTVRRFVAGGERLSAQLVQQWKASVGGEILSLYGTSETFCACMITPPGTSDGMRTGTPLANLEVRLLDSQGDPAQPHEPGILWLRHPALAAGYVNLPERTREHFQEGWFCTHDVFVRDAEGFFVHQGRSDEMVKIAGQWVRPAELEEAVASEAAILEAACVAVPDADGLERLALFVAANGDAGAALQAAAKACERMLPRHKRPKWLRAIEQLPRTATGKVQRFKLREILEREHADKG